MNNEAFMQVKADCCVASTGADSFCFADLRDALISQEVFHYSLPMKKDFG